MPRLQLDLELTASSSETVDLELLRQELDQFLTIFLSTSASRKSFETLDTFVTTTGSGFDVTGVAYYDSATYPSSNDLKGLLIAYFSFWGMQDLKQHLQTAGVPVQDVELSIDGRQVEGLETIPVGDRNASSDGDDDWQQKAIIGGVVGGSAVLLAFMVMAYQYQVNRSDEPPPKANDLVGRHEPPSSAQKIMEQADAVSESGVSGLYSVEDSIYTSNLADGTTRSLRYDASHLDQGISSARKDPGAASSIYSK